VNDVGGIYTDSKSEDVWTSLMLHERGWKTIYIPKTLAIGDAPETIEAYTKQQLRWATGGFEILLSHNPLSPKRKLSMDQRIMYLVTATHYLTGIAPGILLVVPALEIFFDLRPVNLDITWQTWLLFYAGFYLMQIVLAFYTLGSFRWEVLMLAAVSFPIYISALWNAIAKKEQKWHVTGSKAKAKSPFNFMIPQVLVFVFLVLTSVVSIWRDLGNSQLSLATAWNVTNTFILGAFMIVALKENWTINHPPKNLVPDPVEPLVDEEPVGRRTTVIVPPQLAEQLGVPELATVKTPAASTTDDNDNESGPASAERAQQDSDEKEVAAK
jgi:cellulose synthase (UDP-forming)